MLGTNCQTAGCNTSRKHTRIRIFKVPKAKSGMPEHKNRKKNIAITTFFSFMRLCSKSASCKPVPQLFLQLHSFFKEAAIKVATLGQKNITLYLSKVITSGMYNCNFEAINQVLNNKNQKLEYKLFIYIFRYPDIRCSTRISKFKISKDKSGIPEDKNWKKGISSCFSFFHETMF